MISRTNCLGFSLMVCTAVNICESRIHEGGKVKCSRAAVLYVHKIPIRLVMHVEAPFVQAALCTIVRRSPFFAVYTQ